MNKFLAVGLGTAALIVALVVGARFLAPPGSGGVGGVPSTTPSATAAPTATPAPTTTPAPTPTPIGGTVEFQLDGVPVTTVVTAIADGSSVSGTAVSTSAFGTHTVRLECAARQGDRWAFAGTTEQTTVPDERVGDWSAIVVKDGTPQQIGIVFSIQKAEGDFCYARWASMAMADMDVSNPVESGELEPPPDLAP